MAYANFTLPTIAGNGPGTPVDVSAMGQTKTFTFEGTGAVFEPYVIIEIANDVAGARWTPLYSFEQPGTSITIDVACRWARATVTNYRGGGAPVVAVGGNDNGTSFLEVVAPTGNGTGAAVSAAGLPEFKTIQVTGSYGGSCIVEASEDGGTSWATIASFPAIGQKSLVFAADEVRIMRSGVPNIDPGIPICNIGACTIGGGGGGGGSGNAQRFQYTVTGLEADLSELVIPLPAARADALYLVFPAQEEAAFSLGQTVDTASKTTTQFVLSLTNDATAGDVFSFTVDDPT